MNKNFLSFKIIKNEKIFKIKTSNIKQIHFDKKNKYMSIEFGSSNFTLSVIYFKDENLENLIKDIENKINDIPSFLKKNPVVINISSIKRNICWKNFFKRITSTGLNIIGISGLNHHSLKREIIGIGLPFLQEQKIKKFSNIRLNKIKKTKIVDVPIRSGQQIYANNSDLIVINKVSAGAELIADGNIHIYGRMYGKALAGASGDEKCQIFCTYLFAELISIAGQYWVNEQIPSFFLRRPSRLCLRNNLINIYPLI